MLAYNKHWQAGKDQVEAALSQAFEIDTRELFKDLQCNAAMNSMGPRFLWGRTFDVFSLNGEPGATGASIHEFIHVLRSDARNGVLGDTQNANDRI